MAWIILAWLWGGHSRVFGAPCEGRQTIALHNYTILHVIVWFTDAVLEQPFFDDLETTGPKYNRLYAYLILLIKGSFFAVTNGRFFGHVGVGESLSRGVPWPRLPSGDVMTQSWWRRRHTATMSGGSLWVACHVPVCNTWHVPKDSLNAAIMSHTSYSNDPTVRLHVDQCLSLRPSD